ncbi:methyltransferase [Actinocrinis puniceicyclus]|uniref:Methyltransferase n=1 Tax=Actinocrinis puniceicyclus TaxID=977794 RepID=A0A8J7WMJ4_9ACTN|nr:methyltransferase [Actinocrinis puniceicyclus]MBS2962907.1 methyltransferase [Actinocrinis puniceicyclus]
MTFRLTARCVRGLEWLLAAQVAELAAAVGSSVHVQALAERQVTFTAAEADARWLSLSTADDVLLDLGTLYGIDHTRAAVPELARQLARVDFGPGLRTVRRVQQRPQVPPGARFDVVAALLGRRNYNRFAVEDAAGEVIARAVGARYVSRNPAAGRGERAETAESEFTVRLALSGETVEVALRVPRRPLHRRPWKLDTGPGTLHPPLAAALALIGGGAASPPAAILDPFCGDGTVAIEAALAYPGAAVTAADLDARRVANARANAERAGVAARTRLIRADAGRPVWRERGFELLVTNPPWNRAVGAAGALADGLDAFWRTTPDALAACGRICTVADADLDVPARLRRRGYSVALAQSIRLAGRVSHLILAAPPHAAEVALPAALGQWRERAAKAAIVTESGF